MWVTYTQPRCVRGYFSLDFHAYGMGSNVKVEPSLQVSPKL